MTSDYARLRAALPGYDIGDEVGRGGCGVVLAGVHRRLGRAVAIKQIPAQFAHDEQVRRRFIAEARVLAAIDHPHVVRVFDYIEQDDLCLLVMEYLPGGTVGGRFATDGFDAATAVAIALSCAAGLNAAHRHGILHRDVKPSNLMFGTGGAIKLTDFGIAKIVGGDETLVTRAGEIVGTPSYIAPEQARGQPLSPATDVYALSTMLYQLLSGVLPFPPGENQLATLFAHAFDAPVPLGDVAPTVPESIAAVVMRGLATDPGERFDTAEGFGVALATPAAHCWGGDWLTPVGIPVIGADTIVAAATGSSRGMAGSGVVTPMPPVSHGDPHPPSVPSSMAGTGPRTPPPGPVDQSWMELTLPPQGAPSRMYPPPPTPPGGGASVPPPDVTPPGRIGVAPPGTPPSGYPRPAPQPARGPVPPTRRMIRPHAMPRVRPAQTVQDKGIRLADVDRRDLVPIRDVVIFPEPRPPFAVAAGLALVVVLLALVGFGGPARGGDLTAGAVTVAGVDPVTAKQVRVDLSKPISVQVNGIEADAVAITVTVLGVRLGGDSTPLQRNGPGATALVPAPVNPYVLAGTVAGELTLSRNGTEVGTQRMKLETRQRSTTTAVAAGVVLLVLFAAAYVESNMRGLRRGRGGFANSVGLAVSAAVLAVAVVGAAWVLLGRAPSIAGLVVCACVGVAAGIAAAIGCGRIGERYRAVRHAQLRVRR